MGTKVKGTLLALQHPWLLDDDGKVGAPSIPAAYKSGVTIFRRLTQCRSQ